MNIDNLTEEDHRARSNFVRELVQRSRRLTFESTKFTRKQPKRIVQFWDDLDQLPKDVEECIETWRKTEGQGFKKILFDKHQARDFINRRLGPRYERAYDKCYHPAMQSDYFRLCYILVKGGCYIDADDMYIGSEILHLFNDCRLKIQPLCYDMESNMMIPPSVFTKPGANSKNWIFYFNNNPLIAGKGHPLINRALTQATLSLEKNGLGLPEIQSTTGPGNLTKTIFNAVTESKEIEKTFLVVSDWENIVNNKWELSYRNDARNWRLSNCRDYNNDMQKKDIKGDE